MEANSKNLACTENSTIAYPMSLKNTFHVSNGLLGNKKTLGLKRELNRKKIIHQKQNGYLLKSGKGSGKHGQPSKSRHYAYHTF